VRRLAVVAISILLFAPAAGANEKVTLAAGAGVTGRDVAGQWRAAAAPELTFHIPFFSFSTGASVSSDGLDYAYGEVAIHPILTLGGGLGYGAYSAPDGRHAGIAGHALVGLPIPMVSQLSDLADEKRLVPYLLVFYRPAWGPWPGTAHEIGVMVKVGNHLPDELRYWGKGY
jgi:hypothetical protein